ncbi:MAG: 2-oxo-4-hydroxy-4-carboxy-5-ureidoimidazoline decarboxylase [Cyanobacteria bacterium P01_D01_bin.105]
MISIENINQMTQTEFIAQFGSIFEETPTIAERVWTARPFQDVADLHQKMVDVVAQSMTPQEQLVLICAHPELGKRGKMAEASVKEQASAGLSQLNEDDYHRIQTLNAAYRERFGFPFVVAVKGLSVPDVIAMMEERIQADREEEMGRSLSEIYQIARFRLNDLVEEMA